MTKQARALRMADDRPGKPDAPEKKANPGKPVDPDKKVEKPALHFEKPRDVVADPVLSKEQKSKALDTLEQYARQIAEAANEGMTGGEPNQLREVLVAKDKLVEEPIAKAYLRVLEDLHVREKKENAMELRLTLRLAIDSLTDLTKASTKPKR